MKHEILRLENITKYIRGKKVLDNARLNLFSGEILGLVGLNHAGKTVFAKIISGFLSLDKGTFYIDDKEESVNIGNASQKYGIFYIGQDSTLIPGMSIKENIFAFRKIYSPVLLVDEKKMYQQTKELLDKLELDFDPDQIVNNLSVEDNHLIQICRTIMSNSRVIILDGITGTYGQIALTKIKKLLSLISKQGISVIYINNRLDEIIKTADRVTVLKEGRTVRVLNKDEYSKKKILSILGGYRVKKELHKPEMEFGPEVLRVENLSYDVFFSDVSLTLKRGEILGLAIYEESIRDAFGRVLFGLYESTTGNVFAHGRKIRITNPRSAIRSGIGFIPERASHKGIFNNLSVSENIAFLAPRKIRNVYGVVKPNIDKHVTDFSIKKAGLEEYLEEKANNISDIGKLKLIIQRWMVLKPNVLIFVYPTSGIDMLARDEIYSLIYEIVKQGTSIILITSDLSELINMSDRIILFKKGCIKDEIIRSDVLNTDSLKAKILNAFITK